MPAIGGGHSLAHHGRHGRTEEGATLLAGRAGGGGLFPGSLGPGSLIRRGVLHLLFFGQLLELMRVAVLPCEAAPSLLGLPLLERSPISRVFFALEDRTWDDDLILSEGLEPPDVTGGGALSF